MKKLLFFVFFIFATNSFAKMKTFNEEKIDYLSLYNEILEQEVEFPDIVFAQAILESGHFTSKVFKNNKNLFGMKLPKKRTTLAIGQKYGYAVYEYWQESVGDYGLFQEYIFKNKKMSKSQYLSFIDKRYSETSGYVSKLKSIIKRNQEILYEPPSDRNDGIINYTSIVD